MKRFLLIPLLVLGAVWAGDDPKAEVQLASMKWMAGTWSGAMGGGEFVAFYSTSEGGRILSYSEMRQGGRAVFYEFEKFDVQNGKVTATPFPGGKMAPSFQLGEYDEKARKAVFDNPKKDFPTRITYHRTGDDSFVITLTDPHGGSDKKQVFSLKRRE